MWSNLVKQDNDNRTMFRSQASPGTASIRTSITYGAQPELPPLPIPSLDETLNKFLQNLDALQSAEERIEAQRIVLEFMNSWNTTAQREQRGTLGVMSKTFGTILILHLMPVLC